MPDPPRRIIMEKSSTVKRRWQRSNQRFEFTPAEIARLDRDEAREKKAKQLREKEKKRIANKKRKAEQEARAREERRRGIFHQDAPRPPSSQPLLSMFLGAGKPTSAAPEPASAPAPTHTTTETEPHGAKEDTDPGNASGDTEAESDAFDDLDEELKLEESGLPEMGAGIVDSTKSATTEKAIPDDDEFSDCSVFDDIINQAEATASRTTGVKDEDSNNPALPEPPIAQVPSERPGTVPSLSLESSFGDSLGYDAADFLEAEEAITRAHESKAPLQATSLLQPLEQPRPVPALASFGDSFRDETADWIEEAYACGSGDLFVSGKTSQ
ncbi:unnamed protein product [Penicillium olsonii]|uniref:Uncharacterized protein n=1 Tax=Penicillium olsonii TaxID=99116 RepID=A0A9W4I0N1_PENOL|nr:unnamed protein product [Penicillium olsonii]CAG8230997.1 unnamed protein product [Penicillium olsonii]